MPYFNLDYQKHWTAGTVDPRVKSDRFIVKVKPGIAMRYKAQELAVYGSIGKADETLTIQYINDQYGNTSLYPDRIAHVNYGYGYSITKDSMRNTKYDTYKGYGLQYNGSINRLSIRAGYDYQHYHNTNQYFSKSTAEYRGPRAIFNLYSYTANVDLLWRQNADIQHMFSGRYKNSNGYDGSLPASGSLSIVNYRVDETDLGLNYSILLDKSKRFAKEFGVSYGQYTLHQRDLAQVVDLNVAEQRVRAFTNMVLRGHAGETYKLGAGAYMLLPGTHSFDYSALAINGFVRNVANIDYYYYQLQKIGFTLNAEYITGGLGVQRMGFFGSVDYRTAGNGEAVLPLTPDFVPGGTRVTVQLGVRMYLKGK